MSSIKGMGSCAITKADGNPCGRQIVEGEAIGTVIISSHPYVGHKSCADAFQFRQNQESSVVQRADQSGPGGAIGEFRPAVADDARGRVSIDSTPPNVELLSDLPMDDESRGMGLTPGEEEALRQYRAKLKPEPYHVEVTLPRGIPDRADLVIHLKR